MDVVDQEKAAASPATGGNSSELVPTVNKDSNSNSNDEEDDDDNAEPPTAKFQARQRVYAKDSSSGLWYEAVIRRSLYGVNHNKQVQIGLVCSESEINEILEQSAKEPTWHYFVHYNKWAVNWDRWVSEEDVMEATEASKQTADRYIKEHKDLLKELKKGNGGRKSGDGATFLKEWRKRMDKIEEELKKEEEVKIKGVTNTSGAATAAEKGDPKAADATKDEKKVDCKPVVTPAAPPPSKAKPNKRKKPKSKEVVWDKAALKKEYSLKLRGLESKRSAHPDQHKIALPFSLKKVMVEAWEIITQCDMVPNLPASVTVRQVLDQYLKSKLDIITDASSKASAAATTTTTTTKVVITETAPTKDVMMDTKDAPATVEAESPAPKDANDAGKQAEADANKAKLDKKKQEWTDMVEGIAMFFDEALPFRLLFSQELPQFKVVESTFVVPIIDVSTSSAVNEEEKAGETKQETKDGETVKEEGMEDAAPVKPGTDETKPKESEKSGSPVADTTAPVDGKDNASQDTTTVVDAPVQSNKQASSRKIKGVAADDTRPMLPCEIYGCEHLLRLCLKIPELLAERVPKIVKGVDMEVEARKAYETESKQILAKVNDLIRFLHKHQSTTFADSYRKMNESEIREEQKWVRYVERKRKRALEELQEAAVFAIAGAKKEADVGIAPASVSSATEEGPKGKAQTVN